MRMPYVKIIDYVSAMNNERRNGSLYVFSDNEKK